MHFLSADYRLTKEIKGHFYKADQFQCHRDSWCLVRGGGGLCTAGSRPLRWMCAVMTRWSESSNLDLNVAKSVMRSCPMGSVEAHTFAPAISAATRVHLD